MASSWQLGPVLRSIRGHRPAAALVVMQLGIGIAITVLSVLIGDYFLHRNIIPLNTPNTELTFVEVQQRSADPSVLATIRATPECTNAVVIGGLPLHALERDTDDVRRSADAAPISAFALDAGDGFMAASSLALHAGRDFIADDLVRTGETAAIVSAGLAEALWPGENPLGARFVSRSHGAAVVVGVAAPVRSYLFGDAPTNVVYAKVDVTAHTLVLVRSAPGRASAVRDALRARLATPGQHASVVDASEAVRKRFGSVGSVLGILGTIVGTIVLVIFIGSMGLTYFLVTQRTREIGVRRALGATRRDVVRFFIVENIILTIAGTLIGLGLVMAVLPTLAYEQDGFSVSWPLVAVSVTAVILLNLLATLIPARKAATVPPVVASQTE